MSSSKRSSKGKQKKQQRQAELQKLQEVESLVAQANEDPDQLKPFAAFQRYKRRGVDAAVSCCRAEHLSDGDKAWVFRLCKSNMQALYEGAPGMGWSDNSKKRQLSESDTSFLMVTGTVEDGGADAKPLAFCHFRFEVDGSRPVLYCWEVQVDTTIAKRRGLGRFLMTILELLARRHGMEQIMLTVINANTDATSLYDRLGYVMDDSSPSACDPEDDCGYEILCKKLSTSSPC